MMSAYSASRLSGWTLVGVLQFRRALRALKVIVRPVRGAVILRTGEDLRLPPCRAAVVR
jgi:hypothetical protein